MSEGLVDKIRKRTVQGDFLTCMPGARGEQKGVLGSLELELQVAVSYHVRARN